jgi:hypothetical protein
MVFLSGLAAESETTHESVVRKAVFMTVHCILARQDWPKAQNTTDPGVGLEGKY